MNLGDLQELRGLQSSSSQGVRRQLLLLQCKMECAEVTVDAIGSVCYSEFLRFCAIADPVR